jgi:hypothetical protein
MKVGDVVIPARSAGAGFHSGAESYTHAIVASVEPFVLVSQHGDMMWTSTVKSEDVTVLCPAHPDIAAVAVYRYRSGRQPSARWVIHRCPLPGTGETPCCGHSPFDLPGGDRMTTDATLVTCKPSPTKGESRA